MTQYTSTSPRLPVLPDSNDRLAVHVDPMSGLAYYYLLDADRRPSRRPLATISLHPVDKYPNEYAVRIYTSGDSYREYADAEYNNLVHLVRLASEDPGVDAVCGGWP